MQQTRREILDEFLAMVGARRDTDARNRAELLLSRAIMNIWLARPWADHRLPVDPQITTVVGTSVYALPQYFGRIPPFVERIPNLTTGGSVQIVSYEQLRELEPTFGTSLASRGTPRVAAIGSPVGVRVQPSSSGQALEAVSSDGSDTDVKVLIEGVNSDGEWDEAHVTLTGAVAVAVGTWKAPIVNFAKSYPAGTTPATEHTSSRGTVTLRVAGGGATLQSLLPEESAREFPALTLAPAPATAGEVYAIPTLRAPKKLLYDADEVPRFWGSAVLEEMVILWKLADGEVPSTALPRPELARLIGHDNTTGPRTRVRPFRL